MSLLTNKTITSAVKTAAASAGVSSSSYKWQLLVLLWLAYFFNQADRQLFSVVLPLIQMDLSLTDAQLGLISSALVWAYGCLVPVAGFVGDRSSKKWVVTLSLLGWSIATLFTGLCSTFVHFILLRGIATGGAEAFYAPSANTLISSHHVKTRSAALSIHQTAVYAGIIMSGWLAGLIAEKYGWRNTFYVFGIAGIIVAIACLKKIKKDLPTQVTLQRLSLRQTASSIFKIPTVLLLTAGFACMVFVNVGYLTWMPTFLKTQHGLSLSDAGFSSMFYHHIGAFFGVLIGGSLSDRLAFKKPVWRLRLQSFALLLGVPFICFLGLANTTTELFIALGLFGLFRGIYDANIFASLYEVVPAEMRAAASGIMLMFAFLIGAFWYISAFRCLSGWCCLYWSRCLVFLSKR
jgi:sugar phosphate permease